MNGFRIYLRAFEIDDYKITYKWRNDNELWDLLIGRKYFVSTEYERKWIENSIYNNQDNIKLAACLKEDDTHIGNIYLTDIDWFNRNALLGILIGDEKHRGKGFGYEMINLILHHGFNDLGLERIYSKQLTSNIGSIKLHEKCGFRNEGVLRNSVYKNGEYQDVNMMSILKSEFYSDKFS